MKAPFCVRIVEKQNVRIVEKQNVRIVEKQSVENIEKKKNPENIKLILQPPESKEDRRQFLNDG
jgi:transcriptional regulator